MRFFVLCILAWLPLWKVGTVVAGLPVRPPGTPTVRKHLVYLRDKANTPYSLSAPQRFLTARSLARRTHQNISLLPRDLPVDPAYVAQVQAVAGAKVWYTSRWFNAVVVECDSTVLAVVQALPCVRSARTLNRSAATSAPLPVQAGAPVAARPAGTRADYGNAYAQAHQIGADVMHDAGFRGEGMHIAVFDGGFPGVNTGSVFASLYQQNRLASVYNFVGRDQNVYQYDDHGTLVLSTLAGNQPGVFIGTAPQATYYLFVTEEVASEHPVEEVNWLIAAERADSLGVDIINSSLGYNTFDAPSVDYAYTDLDGRTALSTRAATVAARVGMLVVNSAGNEGNNRWLYLLAPADADSILTVGAVDSLGTRARFSSIGPAADGRLKPNVSAMGQQAAFVYPSGAIGRGNGTSFASPIAAGLAAGFWQAHPTLTAQEVIDYLQRSASQATAPDNLLGYGIPNFGRAQQVAAGIPLPTAPVAGVGNLVHLYPNPVPAGAATCTLQLPAEWRAQPLEVRLYDARGALVSALTLPAPNAPTVQLPTTALRPGVYSCRVGRVGQPLYTVRLLRL
ncbi:S8 family serine peptidase [Hymenobacter aerilatus]|uniref:S8 family serine peptidase n=1 Tax=Hymenobacter aerilatus TaxID=2932251 RepID=A0A8T9SYG9_9BACT|nr:S8 family serine peptidase [Hymenobacter aerilatus]UOR06915.1 S8 family serine peptidase [Hymenobacter aerilatus]